MSHPNTSLASCAVGINPIMWSNDDFHELGGETTLDRCLADMHAAGYAGAELGHKFPREAPALSAVLKAHDLRLVSGWHSTYFAERGLAAERSSYGVHLRLLKALGATVFIAAECSKRIYEQPGVPLGWGQTDRPRLDEAEWGRVCAGLDDLAKSCAEAGMTLVYHHHMGTVIQTGDELDRLMAGVPALRLIYDPGHLAFAGLDPLAVLRRHGARVAHVHLKNVRPQIVARARAERWSFQRAVTEGVYTIPGDGRPGDGSVDFPASFEILAQLGYKGWLVVEAEEDPKKAEPLAKAKRARAYVKASAGA